MWTRKLRKRDSDAPLPQMRLDASLGFSMSLGGDSVGESAPLVTGRSTSVGTDVLETKDARERKEDGKSEPEQVVDETTGPSRYSRIKQTAGADDMWAAKEVKPKSAPAVAKEASSAGNAGCDTVGATTREEGGVTATSKETPPLLADTRDSGAADDWEAIADDDTAVEAITAQIRAATLEVANQVHVCGGIPLVLTQAKKGSQTESAKTDPPRLHTTSCRAVSDMSGLGTSEEFVWQLEALEGGKAIIGRDGVPVVIRKGKDGGKPQLVALTAPQDWDRVAPPCPTCFKKRITRTVGCTDGQPLGHLGRTMMLVCRAVVERAQQPLGWKVAVLEQLQEMSRSAERRVETVLSRLLTRSLDSRSASVLHQALPRGLLLAAWPFVPPPPAAADEPTTAQPAQPPQQAPSTQELLASWSRNVSLSVVWRNWDDLTREAVSTVSIGGVTETEGELDGGSLAEAVAQALVGVSPLLDTPKTDEKEKQKDLFGLCMSRVYRRVCLLEATLFGECSGATLPQFVLPAPVVIEEKQEEEVEEKETKDVWIAATAIKGSKARKNDGKKGKGKGKKKKGKGKEGGGSGAGGAKKQEEDETVLETAPQEDEQQDKKEEEKPKPKVPSGLRKVPALRPKYLKNRKERQHTKTIVSTGEGEEEEEGGDGVGGAGGDDGVEESKEGWEEEQTETSEAVVDTRDAEEEVVVLRTGPERDGDGRLKRLHGLGPYGFLRWGGGGDGEVQPRACVGALHALMALEEEL